MAGAIVQVERTAGLLDPAAIHDDDPVSHCHRLDLIMRDIDGRRLQPLMQSLDLGTHLDAQLGVEVAQRLIEQKHFRLAHDRTPHGHALPLPARKLLRVSVHQRAERQDLARSPDLGFDFRLRSPRELQREFWATVLCG
ncbi:hypothetical protein ASE04_06280 [Rhizobium sp. Root708]|nr:hypothetical protein ASE04_06280 [Rhizobium sp. Root708]